MASVILSMVNFEELDQRFPDDPLLPRTHLVGVHPSFMKAIEKNLKALELIDEQERAH